MEVHFSIKSRHFRLIRYAKILGGLYTFHDDVIGSLFHRMVRDEILERYYLCVESRQQTSQNFIQESKEVAPHMWLVKKGEPSVLGHFVGFVHVMNIRPKRAEMHWMAFKDVGKDLIRCGQAVFEALIKIYRLDVAYGFTPACFPDAIKFLERIGCKRSGTLHDGSYIAMERRSVDAILMSYSLKQKENGLK